MASEAHYGEWSWIPVGPGGRACRGRSCLDGDVLSYNFSPCFFSGGASWSYNQRFPNMIEVCLKVSCPQCFIFIPFNKDVSGLGITRLHSTDCQGDQNGSNFHRIRPFKGPDWGPFAHLAGLCDLFCGIVTWDLLDPRGFSERCLMV